MDDAYHRHAQRFFEQYQSLRLEAVHHNRLTHLP